MDRCTNIRVATDKRGGQGGRGPYVLFFVCYVAWYPSGAYGVPTSTVGQVGMLPTTTATGLPTYLPPPLPPDPGAPGRKLDGPKCDFGTAGRIGTSISARAEGGKGHVLYALVAPSRFAPPTRRARGWGKRSGVYAPLHVTLRSAPEAREVHTVRVRASVSWPACLPACLAPRPSAALLAPPWRRTAVPTLCVQVRASPRASALVFLSLCASSAGSPGCWSPSALSSPTPSPGGLLLALPSRAKAGAGCCGGK
ncbi:hypothetical protein GGS23DRAFT_547673 [Durotheca rogersii]|uniref:uncharacterized protein n=1 Tax=Durotheca rogersii TaxID=419775 RepID=UPI00221F5A25|nr:uncharacterized protein GGS23DRAFT_547673 [Durotheca rogersii]KAI5867288.1 hypothetical protein GGS23DRAFT_547673 [Durotheca rogersii]